LEGFSEIAEDQMNVHKNARLTPLGREWIVGRVDRRQTPEAVSLAAGVCARTVRKWVERFRAEGLAGLQDAPQVLRNVLHGTSSGGGDHGRSPSLRRHTCGCAPGVKITVIFSSRTGASNSFINYHCTAKTGGQYELRRKTKRR
jgi:hypothetical protein